MKRPWLILVAGLALAVAAYAGLYFAGTASRRTLEDSANPELCWLKEEFHIADGEFERICRMHDAYMEGCMERCRKIDAKNIELKQLLAATNTVTLEIQQRLAEAGLLRAECQQKMLQHFYEVSRTMPPEQGRRYLAWVQGQTVLADTHAGMQPRAEPATSHHH